MGKIGKIVFPEEWTVDDWYGYKRHHFKIDGCEAWIVEPEYPVPDKRWTWCVQWAEAFVKRVGVLSYLEHGFYHGFIDVHKYHGSPKAMEIMSHFHDKACELGLSAKVNLLGLSWGGLYSLRYAETFPKRVCSIYLDAPVCDAGDKAPCAANRLKVICEQWNMTEDEVSKSKLNPINNVKPILSAKIPVFAIIGGADNVVLPENNFGKMEIAFKKAGGTIVEVPYEHPEKALMELKDKCIYVYRRGAWAHHPHGFDDVSGLLRFNWSAREK